MSVTKELKVLNVSVVEGGGYPVGAQDDRCEVLGYRGNKCPEEPSREVTIGGGKVSLCERCFLNYIERKYSDEGKEVYHGK